MSSWMFMMALGILQFAAAGFVIWEQKSPYLAAVYMTYGLSNFLMIGVAAK